MRVVIASVLVASAGVVLIIGFGGGFPLAQAVAPLVMAALALITIVFGTVSPRAVARFDSLRSEILVVSMTTMLITGLAIAGAAAIMIVEPPQFGILLVVALTAVAFGVVIEYAVAHELSADARRLGATARRIGDGDLEARTEIDRADEIGQAARSIDSLAMRLVAVERERVAAMTARSDFLAAIGHDLRTPLSALWAALEAVEDGLSPDPARYFQAMRKDIEALRRLVDDLFLLARIEGGHLEFERIKADLSELTDEAVEALSPIAVAKAVTVVVESDARAIAEVGPSEFSRIIRSLLDNAIRHTPSGSRVGIRLTPTVDGVDILVSDAGVGIPHHVVVDLERGLARSEHRGNGAGFGLAIARGLVAAHGGRLWFEAGPGGRVIFRVPTGATPAPAVHRPFPNRSAPGSESDI